MFGVVEEVREVRDSLHLLRNKKIKLFAVSNDSCQQRGWYMATNTYAYS
jgi:hypothetical protein